MIGSLPLRGIGAAALAAGLLLAGCSSDSDVPKTMASAPGGGTEVNTDTGSGGGFPDVNSVPAQRPTSTIQDLNQAPEGLSGAQSGAQYGEPIIGGPTSSAAPPAPPPPPEPAPEEHLPPNPEAGIQSDDSNDTGGPTAEPSSGYQPAAPAPTEPTASREPIATPEIAEPQPMEPAQSAEAVQSPAPASAAPEGQTIQGTMQGQATQPAPVDDAAQPAPMAAAPEPQPQAQPVIPAATPQPSSPPSQPESPVMTAPSNAPIPSPGSTQQPQARATAYGPNYAAATPEAYGISSPTSSLSPNQPSNSQATYRSSPIAAPTHASYGQPSYEGQPVGLIYFDEGSSKLSSDDRGVLKQIADMQRAHGGIVHVVGHASMRASGTDYTSHQQANQRISEARANAVVRELMSYGVPQGAIQAAGAGDLQPLYSEAVPSGEAANRRAEVYLSAY